MKFRQLIVATVIATSGFASAATCVVQFSNGTNLATGFADASGSAAAGLVWGIIVSNGDNLFTNITKDFVLATTLGTGTAGTQIGTSNDYYFGSSVLTANQTTGGEAGALGKIGSLTAITQGASATIGSAFALVWFDRTITSATGTIVAGTKYGILTDAAFVIPASGLTANLSAPFSATGDPIKSANTVTVVPEPSAALLGALGALGLLRRRRI